MGLAIPHAEKTKVQSRLWSDAIVLVLLPTALNLPRLYDPFGSKIIYLALLLFLIFKNFIFLPTISVQTFNHVYRRNLSAVRTSIFWLVGIFACILIASVARGLGSFYTLTNALSMIGFLLLTPLALFSSFLIADSKDKQFFITMAFLMGLPLFVFINVVLSGGGLAAPISPFEDRSNQILSLIGLDFGRAFFPLAYGTNVFGSLAAISALTCFLILANGSRGISRFLLWTFGITSLAASIMTDSRGALGAALLSGLGALWLVRKASRVHLVTLGVVLVPVLPYLIDVFFEFANKSGILSFMVRSGSKGLALGVGTGRGEVWNSVFHRLADFEPLQLIGYGAYGHVISGASAEYAWVFDQLGLTAAGVHNAFLQYILDTGYIGAVVWLGVLFILLKCVRLFLEAGSQNKLFASVLAGFTIFLILHSQMETFGTIYTLEALQLLFMMLVTSAFLLGKDKKVTPS